jgi:hypothetical protein
MSGKRANILWLATLGLVLCSSAGLAQNLRIDATHNYVKGYKVVDGIAVPVIGTYGESVKINPRVLGISSSRGRSNPALNSRADMDAFSKRCEDVKLKAAPASVKSEKKAKAVPLKVAKVRRAPVSPASTNLRTTARRVSVGPRSTTIVGELTREGDEVVLSAKKSSKTITYKLMPAQAALQLLAQNESGGLRVVVVGKLDDRDSSHTIHVTRIRPLR